MPGLAKILKTAGESYLISLSLSLSLSLSKTSAFPEISIKADIFLSIAFHLIKI